MEELLKYIIILVVKIYLYQIWRVLPSSNPNSVYAKENMLYIAILENHNVTCKKFIEDYRDTMWSMSTTGFIERALIRKNRASTEHYNGVIMGAIASQITSLTIVYSIVYSDADQRKHQSSASLAFVRGIHWGPVNFPHKWPVTRKMFSFDDVIMNGWAFICTHAMRRCGCSVKKLDTVTTYQLPFS